MIGGICVLVGTVAFLWGELVEREVYCCGVGGILLG